MMLALAIAISAIGPAVEQVHSVFGVKFVLASS
jgi:hypothetical protein